MTISVIQSGAVVLEQNVIYRARLEVVPPFGPAATEGAVAEELGKQGFANIRFYDRDKVPVDWPIAEKADDSGFMGKTYYLEGRFVLTGRRIPLSELGSKVNLRSMWVHLVPVPVPTPGAPPVPTTPPVPPPTTGSTGFELSDKQAKIMLGWATVVAAFLLTRRYMRHAARTRR